MMNMAKHRTQTQLAAAELVASLKRMDAVGVDLPIADETAVWHVKVKRLGIKRMNRGGPGLNR
jgi:hypothetical protein